MSSLALRGGGSVRLEDPLLDVLVAAALDRPDLEVEIEGPMR